MTNVKMMTEYLGYAVKMEQNVYTLKKALAYVTHEYKQANKNLESSTLTYDTTLYALENDNVDNFAKANKENNKKKLKLPGIIILIFVISFALAGISFILGIALDVNSSMKNIWAISLILPTLVMTLSAPLAMVAGIKFLYHLIAYKNSKKEATRTYATRQMQFTLENEASKKEISIYSKQCKNLLVNIKQLKTDLNSAENNLKQLYGKNLLPPVYRNLVAVGTLYGYLINGRCTTIEGHGGIYDTYEYDVKLNTIICKLDDVLDNLESIKNSQHELYTAIKEGNAISNKIYNETKNIAKNTAQTAISTAAIAMEQKQISDNLSYMAWWKNY